MAEKKIAPSQFVAQAIRNLRRPDKSPGIHAVFSGLNDAWRSYYGTDPRAGITKLADQGKVEVHPCKGGVMVYFPGEAPPRGTKALGTILHGKAEEAEDDE